MKRRHKDLGKLGYVHWQGLGKDNYDLWPEGRVWLRLGDPEVNARQVIGVEWHFWQWRCGASIDFNSVDGDHGITVSLSVPGLGSLYATVEQVPKWLLPGHFRESVLEPGVQVWQPEERSIGVRVFDWTVWFSLWDNVTEWNRSDPWWWRFNINVPDLVLGKSKFSRLKVASGEIGIPMPEGSYPAKWEIMSCAWKRPRWPWPKRKLYVGFTVQGDGIPLPGKGENSWDCGDDAICSSGWELMGTVEEAAFEFACRIVQDRVRLCGREVYP